MIRHIKYGTDEVFQFDYNGENLPLRPISSYELDQCFYKTLVHAEKEIGEIFLKLKLGALKPGTIVDYDNEFLAELRDFYDNLDYLVVFYSMKDFQPETFSVQDVKKLQHVHEMASKIYGYSYQPKEVVKEIVKDEAGKHVATIVFNLNVPLGKLSELTKLQRDFLILSKLERVSPTRDISKSGDVMNLGDILGDLVNERTDR